MKTYKKYGIAAAAWAALVCTMAVTARAADGDIWSIRRAAGGDHGTETLSMSGNPVTAGQTVKFKLRLLNRDPAANYTAHGGAASATTWDNRWYFKYVGAGGTNEAASAASLYPPKVGVWVSGRYQWADVESLAPVSYVSGGSEVVNYDFTDLICSYTAQPGDFGLLTLAAGSESAPVEASTDNEATTYCLKNGAYWGIYDKLTTTNACNLKLTSQSQGAISSFVTFPTDDEPKFVQDRDLSQAGIYIRTIDFDDYKFNDDVWRRIAANGTSSYVNNGNAKRAPALSIPGSVATEHTVTLYAWAEDETVAYMKDGVDYDFGGGVTRKVVHIPIAPADGEIKEIPGGIFAMGDATNKTTKIFLSATPTNIFRAGVMITNFVTKTVLVGQPEPPSIVVKPGGASDWTAVAGSPAEIVPITVELEGVASYTSDLDVTVTAEMIGSSADWKDFIGLSTMAAGDPNGTSATATIRAGTQSAFVYAYVKRASDDTSASTKGISIKAEITDAAAIAYFSGGIIPGTLHIQPSKPKITSPATDTVYYDVPAGEAFEMSFNVDDAVGELTGSYTLEYTLTGIWSTMNTKTLDVGVPSGTDNTLTTNIIFNTTSSNILVRVRNQDNYVSDPIHLTVEVFAKPLIGATPYDHVGTDGNPSRTYNEGDTAKLSFTLGTPFALADAGYIFLVPQTEASSNLVDTTAFEQGIRIVRGQSATERQASLLLLDGAANTELRYEFEIWNTPTKTEAGAVRIGTGTDGYASGEITLFVENVMPKVEGVSMSDTPLFTNNGTMEAKAAKDVTKIFKIESVDEPSDIDLGDTNTPFRTEWKFWEGGTVLFTTNVYGNPYNAEVPYAFHNSGTNKVTVKVMDKDMTQQQFKQSPTFTFFVETLDEPTISLMPYNGSFYYSEDKVGSIDGRVDVNLNIAPTETIEVEITVDRDGASDGLTTDPVLNTNRLTFTTGTTSRYFYFKELDGGANFIVRAKVITTTPSVDPNKTWAEYYHLEDENGYPMTVDNLQPMISGIADTNAIPAGIGVPTKPIQWEAKDVLPDIRDGMIASWTVEGVTVDVPITTTNATGTKLGSVKGSYSPVFSGAGLKIVTLTVTDKNGDYDTRQYYFSVDPAKKLSVIPTGPNKHGQSDLSADYAASANGLGAGRVWSEGAPPTISAWEQSWTFSPEVSSVNVFAYGYRVGETASGLLSPGTSYKLDPYGNLISNTVTSVYAYPGNLDSFFYCWVLSVPNESDGGGKDNNSNNGGSGNGSNGGYTSMYQGSIQPVVGIDATDFAKQAVSLPAYDKETISYPTYIIEAIFSREYFPKDNVGDINADGIPDVYAVKKWNGGSAVANAEGTTSGSGRLFDEVGGDLKSLDTYNGDEDYLPVGRSSANGLIPNVKSDWAQYGKPFTAYLELRGYGAGLNYREDASRTQGVNSDGAWISERDFTEVESNAWATIYGSDANWTPENRTDPTVDDTDGDGLPDGYEYYFWYRGYIGDPYTGQRIIGSRFRLDDIAEGEPISPDEIARLFNPNVKSDFLIGERDSDNDGLLDIEEFALGTNPIHWDTDADGVSDYWEVMRGLDPLVAEAWEEEVNPDKDYMAWATIGSNYAVISFTNASGVRLTYALANNGDGLIDADGKIIATAAANSPVGTPVFRYGDSSSTEYLPVSRGKWAKRDWGHGLAGLRSLPWTETYCTEKPSATKPIEFPDGWDEDALTNNVTVLLKQSLCVAHDQVMAEFEFDPRTAWGMNMNGYVSDRWDSYNNENATQLGEAGIAVNTRLFSNRDEYLLLKYRYMTAKQSGNAASTLPGFVKYNPTDAGDTTFSLDRDLAALESKMDTLGNIFLCGTTNPNKPFTAEYGDETYATTSSDDTHGADTDGDSVPDGWELYVGFNPNSAVYENAVNVDYDKTGLCLAGNYAGTDSCNAYRDVVSVYTNHPGLKTGWFNKFWPTNPWDGDTDGDHIRDDTEGGTWNANPVYNHAFAADDGAPGTQTYTFVYDAKEGEKPTDDGLLLCIRGGGMNPCSVDTDGDALPDPWEMCYAGLVAKPEKADDGLPFGSGALTLIRRSDGLPDARSASKATGYYITAGMDATDANDAFTFGRKDGRTGTSRDFDFDHDGLQNYQEYLVQALRHLRYDDAVTPLMGRWMPGGTPASEKFLGFIEMNYMDEDTFSAAAAAAGFTSLSSKGYFRVLGYFARPPREWDPTGFWGGTKSSKYDTLIGGYRIMLPPRALVGSNYAWAHGYASTDPRSWDTDNDNMDDYYELFHGLNPLLGSVAVKEPGEVSDGDVISDIYWSPLVNDAPFSFRNNAWLGWPGITGSADWLSSDIPYTLFDAMKYPWMMGSPEADADGDGIRNADEALVVNMTSPQPQHTDPTPLWMTDSTALNKASYTSQYYIRDTDFNLYPWIGGRYGWADTQGTDGTVEDFLFSFEENEGYDTDHDWISDSEEQRSTTTAMSDAQNFTDPDRRQAIWFPGDKSAAVSRSSSLHRLNYQSYDTFRQFTVEAWIKPEVLDREQTIIERSAVYGASTLSNNLAQVRANFRIGIKSDGRLYGCFDSSDAIPSGTGVGTATVFGGVPSMSEWTHVAFSFDGTILRLYVNGKQVETQQTHLIPANGLVNFVEEAVPWGTEFFPVVKNGYTSVPCAVVLGASARTREAFEISKNTAWTDFGDFYAGYLDEVRIWDGARSEIDIEADRNSRYSFADVAALRETIFASWASGATRNDNDGKQNLPAELVMHYNFQSIPGATNAADVAWEPSGFTKNVRDNDKIEGWNVPGDIYCGWWYDAKTVRSTVYRNWRLVPWIANTVGHLPPMDGSAVDSEYWSKWYGGFTAANEVGVDNIVFPNTANPYPYVMLSRYDRTYHSISLNKKWGLDLLSPSVASNFWFDLRTAVVGTSDLVPLGGAFAKRCEGMWDGKGAADAWMMTKRDTNANEIPDWWETVAKDRYGAEDGFGLESVVTYEGRKVTAREAYQRDIMKGMLPDGVEPPADSVFADVTSGADGGSIPTWWRNLTGVKGGEQDDDDNDGLSNLTEYRVSEVLNLGLLTQDDSPLNPLNAFTYGATDGQLVPDYFLRVPQPQQGITNYLGFMYADHDFLEDAWEDQFERNYLSRGLYDAWKDADDDGWSNFAEARAGSNPSRQNEVGVSGYVLPGHPIPDIALTLNNADGSVFSFEQNIIVQVFPNGKLDEIPSARWRVGGGDQNRFLGVNQGRKMTLTLGPGAVEQGTVRLNFKCPVWYNNKWEYRNGILIGQTSTFNIMSGWNLGASDLPDSSDPTQGVLFWGDDTKDVIGTINYLTGRVEIDFAKCNGGLNVVVRDDSETQDNVVLRHVEHHDYPSDEAWFRIEWHGVMASGNMRQVLRLAEPELAQSGVSSGMVREGKNTFVAFIDENGDRAYTVGEPYGVATDVEVGWFGTSLEIEMSRTASQGTRVKLPGSGETRVRVVRARINGMPTEEVALLDRKVDLAKHPCLTEADFLVDGTLDLDWGELTNVWLAAGNANIAGLTNVTYSVLTGEVALIVTDLLGQDAGLRGNVFNASFEAGGQQTLAEPVEPMGANVYATSPTFRWKHKNSISKDYPAFRLRVWGVDGETLVYDSGPQKTPKRDSNGIYEWVAPIYAGMVTPQGAVFETGKAYRWSVSMLDAKFTEPNNAETKGDFTLKCTGDSKDAYGYGSINVSVKYFGALAEKLPTDVTQFTNLVRVQAFESPDFTGTPVGEAFVTNVADIASYTNLTVNATILGVPFGAYYVRAFIDTEVDCAWAQWESWGYYNYVGTEERYVYTPRAAIVAKETAAPSVTVYIEDADTNNNNEPDAWEWNERGALGASAIGMSVGGLFVIPEDGGGLLDPAQEMNLLDLALKPATLTNVTLRLTLENLTGDAGNLLSFATNGVVLANTTNELGVMTAFLEIDANVSHYQVSLTNMDGTAGSSYLITATATNALDRYRPGEFRLTVTNIAPVIAFTGNVTNDSPTNAVNIALNKTFEIPLTVDDVASDLAAGVNVFWMGDGLVALDDDVATVVTNLEMVATTNDVKHLTTTNRLVKTYNLRFEGGASGLRSATIYAVDKDGGVSTREFWYYVIVPHDDFDNDGISNYMEDKAVEAGYLPEGSYTNSISWGEDASRQQIVTDYFLPGTNGQYLGFMYGDHDFMDDWWEDQFDPDLVSRFLFDAWDDPDDDGWSNWAEARVQSDPTIENRAGVAGYTLPEHPVPEIDMTLSMADGTVFAADKELIVSAYVAGEQGEPDAIWRAGASQEKEKYLGWNPKDKREFQLGPAAVEPGTFRVAIMSSFWLEVKPDGTIRHYVEEHERRALVRDIPLDEENARTGKLFAYGDTNNVVGAINYLTGEISIDFSKCLDPLYIYRSGTDYEIHYPDVSYVFLQWQSVIPPGNRRVLLRMTDPEATKTGVSRGALREGMATFTAFLDEDGDGLYTLGEPYGAVANVDVGWSGTTCAIELSRTAPQLTRVALSGVGEKRIGVARTLQNGEESASDNLAEFTLNVSERPFLSEADLLSAGMLDLDWGTLAAAWIEAGNSDVSGLTNATYSVSVGEVASDGAVVSTFVNTFEPGLQQTLAVPVYPDGGFVYAASPTFRWTHENDIEKSYPAFRLRVWSKDGVTLVYDSGALQAPPRNDDGVYEWTAPIYAGMVTPQGVVFEATNSYKWAVSMLDAKFTEPNFAETKSSFILATAAPSAPKTDSDYGAVNVAVKYFGPLADKLSTDYAVLTNLVRVQAFASPDFTGTPVGEAFVTNVADIASISNISLNATIRGLKPGKYFMRAFLDTDADSAWSRWETWGYANHVGTDAAYLYEPLAVMVAVGEMPKDAVVYMEDMDTNQNGEPDSKEWYENGALGSPAIGISAGGAPAIPEDGGALLDPAQELDGLDLTLRPVPNSPVTLKLTIKSVTGNMDNMPVFADTNGVAIPSSTNDEGVVTAYLEDVLEAHSRVRLLGMDGTLGSEYLVTVVATNAMDIYDPGEFRLLVTNCAPAIGFSGAVTNDTPTNAVVVALGAAVDIHVTVDDVAADLAGGLNVYWQGNGLISTNAAVVTTNGMSTTTNGVTLVTNKVDATFTFAFMEGSSGLRSATIVAEDKDGGISMREFWYYVVAPQDDFDNDGLANGVEMMLEGGFLQGANLFPKVSYTNMTSRLEGHGDQEVPDYFLKQDKTYLGFMFTDHDFMEDWWEDLYDPDWVSRRLFDAWDDPDSDGWCNYAEARAGTDPMRRTSLLMDGETLPESPTPTIKLKVTYSSSNDAQLSAPLFIKAYVEDRNTAVWKVSVSQPQQFTMNLGANSGDVKSFNLGSGSVVPGSISVLFRDPNSLSHSAEGGNVWQHPSTTTWHLGVIESYEGGTSSLRRGSQGEAVGSVTYETGEVTLDLSKLQDYLYDDITAGVYNYVEPSASNEWVRVDLSRSFVKIAWTGKVASDDGRTWETYLAAPNVTGRLTEGKTLFEVFSDTDGDGAWTAGEPYGIVADVDVGWAGASAEVEMTDVNPSIFRINMGEAVVNNDFASQQALSDRGRLISGEGANRPIGDGHEGTNMPSSASSDVKLRIVRRSVNGVFKRVVNTTTTSYASRGVLDMSKNLGASPMLTEMDLLSAGYNDLDWGGFSDTTYLSNLGLSFAAVTTVVYNVVIGNGSISATTTNNNLATCFVNRFEYGATQSKTTPIAPVGHIYTQPTFKWRHDNSIGKDYPAFQLKVMSGSTVIYDSGARKAPPRDKDGVYSWTAPIYPDMLTPAGKVFATSNSYTWAVSMLDAKFTSFNTAETKMDFRLVSNGHLGETDDYGMIRARVRYFGPVSAETTKLAGLVRVQAFTRPDFSGMPAGEAYVRDVSTLASENAIDINAVILGLKAGTYYVRAFIDTDGDVELDRWESWGYGNYVGTDNPALYEPRAYEVRMNGVMPEADIYIEDMDTDRDALADAWEMSQSGKSLTTRKAATGPTFFTMVNPDLATALSPVTFGVTNSSPAYAPVTLMSALVSSAPPVAEGDVAVRIDSFSLADGLDLTVTSDVRDISGGAQSAVVFSNTANVNVVLVAAKKPDFSDAVETIVETLTLSAQGTKEVKVSAEKIRNAIEKAGLGDAAFFKVKLEQ